MSTITDKLEDLILSADDIKQAIEDKGVSMENTRFSQYASKIAQIPTGLPHITLKTGQQYLFLENYQAWLDAGYVPVLLKHRRCKGSKRWAVCGDYLNSEETWVNYLGFDATTGKLSMPYVMMPPHIMVNSHDYLRNSDVWKGIAGSNGWSGSSDFPLLQERYDEGKACAWVVEYDMPLMERAAGEGWSSSTIIDAAEGYSYSELRVLWGKTKITYDSQDTKVYRERHFSFGVVMVHSSEVENFARRLAEPTRSSNIAEFEVVSCSVKSNSSYASPTPANKTQRYKFFVK